MEIIGAKQEYHSDNIHLYQIDCMDYMKDLPDNAFDLAIVDPPYGIGEDGGKRRIKKDRPNSYTNKLKYAKKNWDIKPPSNYFKELFRVSRNQIIWGGNFFVEEISKNSNCWIIWDKNIGGDQADGELAWTSFKMAIRIFKGHPFIGTNGGKKRIHPTQKPIALYKWLLKNYATPDMKIIDTHGGSMSSMIACHDFGCDAVCCEIDKEYYNTGKQRVINHMNQLKLF